MNQLIKKFLLALFGLSCFVPAFAQLRTSSDLYCVNVNNTDDAPYPGWEDPKHKPPIKPPVWFKKYSNVVTKDISSRGWNRVQLYGDAYYATHSGKENLRLFADVGDAFFADDPFEFCANLVKICTDQFGSAYKFIGAGNGSVLGWNAVTMHKKGDDPDDYLYSCPNWRTADFIERSDYDPSAYRVECWRKPPKREQSATFTLNENLTTKDRLVYSGGGLNFGFPNVINGHPDEFPNQGVMDYWVGLFYCSNLPGE